jgi:pyridoxal 5'-phosphate synthase pdxT subunit
LSEVPRVGVLSLQGDFACHHATLEALGVTPQRVTLPRDLEGLDALILPGGESTTMLRLLEATGLREPVARFVERKPVLGTCAGLILLGREVSDLPATTFGIIDAAVERNAYGRQIDSFTASIESPLFEGRVPGVFIRAPRIRRVGPGVEIVARLATSPGDTNASFAGETVGVRSGTAVGLCFHPELTLDHSFHRWFLIQVAGLELAVPETVTGGGREASA